MEDRLMHFCDQEARLIAWIVGGITLVPLYCRWCWYKIRGMMNARRQLPPPAEDRPQA